jgi:hypothetical protein
MQLHAFLTLIFFKVAAQLPALSSMYIKTQDICTIYGLIFVQILHFHPKKRMLIEDI